MVVTPLLPGATVEAVYACLGWFAVATLAGCVAILFEGAAGRTGRQRPGWMLLAALSLAAVSTWVYLTPASGRPECLSELLIVLAVIAALRVPPSWRPVVAGVFLGLLAATQTVNAILFGLAYSVHASMLAPREPRPVRRWLTSATVAGSLGLLVFAVVLTLGPHPAGETLRGILAHARQLAPGHFSVTASYLSASLSGSFYGLFFLMFLAGFLWLERPRIHWLTVLNLGLLSLAVWYFAIRTPNLAYNVFAFVPALAALTLRRIARLDAEADPSGGLRPRYLPTVVAAIVFALMSVGLWRNALTFALYEKYGVSYAEAKARFAELVPPRQPTPVRTMYSLWPLATRFDHLYLDQVDKAGHPLYGPEPVPPLFMLHQWYGRWPTPPVLPGYRLVWTDFVERPLPRLFGFSLSTTAPGYAFALYQPTDPPH